MRITRTTATAIVALLALAATGCVALKNAPAGGGAITTSSYTIGPFNLAATGQPGWESETTQTNVPRPAGAFGIKTMSFDLVDQNGEPDPAPHGAPPPRAADERRAPGRAVPRPRGALRRRRLGAHAARTCPTRTRTSSARTTGGTRSGTS